MTPFCPQCRTEYRQEFTKCSDCASNLVESLPPEADNRNEIISELIPVYDASDQMAAIALSSFLNGNGIRAIVKSEQIPMYDGLAMMLFPRWGQVMVLENQYEKAKMLIDEYLAGESLADENEPQQS